MTYKYTAESDKLNYAWHSVAIQQNTVIEQQNKVIDKLIASSVLLRTANLENAIQVEQYGIGISEGDSDMPKERVIIGQSKDGKPIYKWATGKTRMDVLVSAAKILHSAGIQVYPDIDAIPCKHIFKDYAEKWYATFKKATLAPLTDASYTQQLHKHIYPAFGEMCIEDIKVDDIQAFFNERTYLKRESQQKLKNIMRMIFDAAYDDELIQRNPVKSKRLKLTNKQAENREPLKRDEMASIIAQIPNVEKVLDRCFIALQTLHAMRPCEVLGLKWADIDLKAGTIHIQRNVVHPQRNQPVVGETKTAQSNRKIPITEKARTYIEAAAREAQENGNTDGFIFGRDKAYSYTQHRKMLKRIKKHMDMGKATGYTFRHTILTDIYESTHDANITAAVAGHSKTTTTMNRYVHARTNAAAVGIRAIDSVYSGV